MVVGRVYVIYTTLARPRPKDKIVLCICAAADLFFWINTDPARHGIGQLPLVATDHPALTHDCHLDCSRVTTFPPRELEAAEPRAPISKALARRIVAELQANPPKTLPATQLALAIANLSQL